MLRLQALGSNTECPTPKKRSWPSFERASGGGTFSVLVGYCQDAPWMDMLDQFESSPEFGGASQSGGCEDDEPGDDKDDDEDEKDGDS
ncbi:hypothetical protein Tco_1279901 [Tanacetum coccineum]